MVVPQGPPNRVTARVDLSEQTTNVYVGALAYTFPVSTGRGRYATSTGQWKAEWSASDMAVAQIQHGAHAVVGLLP